MLPPAGTLLAPTPRNFSWALCSGLIRLRKGALGEGRRDAQLASTHPSSGRVDSVRSFHSAQKASRHSQFSSDTWQLSSEVAMMTAHSLWALFLPGPLNSPLLPLLPLLQGLFSGPLASDAISRAKTHCWGTLGPGRGLGYPDSGCPQVRGQLLKSSRCSRGGGGPQRDTSWCLTLLRHRLGPGTCPASCHLGTCPLPHPFP